MKSFLLLTVFSLLVINCTFSQISCNNWLKLSNSPDGATIGDLDMTGTIITVEVIFNKTSSYTGGTLSEADLISKHLNRSDCNYLLRPGHAEITTTNGFFATPEACEIKLNKTYHAAMVYDGSTLKFYRNGYLMEQINATGNMVTNDWLTKIGETAGSNSGNTHFIGFINEVRIWNVARTQAQIRANMDTSLLNPATQPGLKAYYTFDNLLNKQGNPTLNGSLNGAAVINSTNTACNFIADSCEETGGGGGRNCFVNAGKDTTICSYGQVQLNADGSALYVWSPSAGLSNANIANPVATVDRTATYTVTGTALDGCIAKDAVTIVVEAKANFSVLPKNANICTDSSVQLIATGGNLYQWAPANSLSDFTASNPIATPDTTTVYNVAIKDTYCNYDTTMSVTINVNPKPIITVYKDGDFSCYKPTVQLNASGGVSYTWTPSSGLSNANISNPIAIVPSNITFYVSVISSDNCISNDSVRLNFTGNTEPHISPLPTAFTPNDDGLNDCFGIDRWNNTGVRKFEIFNRWGQIVFQGDNSHKCWDGMFNGKKQQTGVYPYFIEIKTVCGEAQRKGTVVLIR